MKNIFKFDYLLNPIYPQPKYKLIDQLNNTKQKYNTIRRQTLTKQYNKISPALRDNKILSEYLS